MRSPRRRQRSPRRRTKSCSQTRQASKCSSPCEWIADTGCRKECSFRQVRNPSTNRCVLKTGDIGKRVMLQERCPICDEGVGFSKYTCKTCGYSLCEPCLQQHIQTEQLRHPMRPSRCPGCRTNITDYRPTRAHDSLTPPMNPEDENYVMERVIPFLQIIEPFSRSNHLDTVLHVAEDMMEDLVMNRERILPSLEQYPYYLDLYDQLYVFMVRHLQQ